MCETNNNENKQMRSQIAAHMPRLAHRITMHLFCQIFTIGLLVREVMTITTCTSATQSGSVRLVKGSATATYNAAISYCASIGGYLPEFATAAEISGANTFFGTTGYTQIWLGYSNYGATHSATAPGIWKTNNGTGATMATSNWYSGQPNDVGGSQYCAVAKSSTSWQWNDKDCTVSTVAVVCMCPLPTTTSTTTTSTSTTTTTPTTTSSTTTTTTPTTTSTTKPTTTSSTTSTTKPTTTTSSTTTTTKPTTTTSTTTTTSATTSTTTTSTTAVTPTGTNAATPITTTTANPTTLTATVTTTSSLSIMTTTHPATTTTSTATGIPVTTLATTTPPATTTSTTAAVIATTSLSAITTFIAIATGQLYIIPFAKSSTVVLAAPPLTIQCPCANGGICANIKTGDLTCTCVGNWMNDQCTKYGFPKDAAGVASFVSQMTGCSVVVALLSLTVGAYIIVRDRLPQPVLIFLGDLSILVAHVLIYTCRAPFIADLSDHSCRLVSLFVQLFVLSHFAFLLLQSLHAYSMTTNVNTAGWWPLPVWLSIIFGFGLPALIIGVSAALYFSQFNLAWDCLVNYNSNANYLFLLPSVFMLIVTIILSEAAGMDSRDRKRLLLQSNKEWLSAQVGQRSSVVIFIFSFLAIIFTTKAIFHLDVYLSTAAFAMNVVFGIFVFFFHCLENTRIRSLLRRGWNIVRCKSSTTHHSNTTQLTWSN